MNNNNLDPVSEGLWTRARMICISMMQGDDKRTRAERNFSMIESVSRDGDIFKIYLLNKLAADRFDNEYGEQLRKCFLLAGADSSLKIEITFDETAKREIIIDNSRAAAPKVPAASSASQQAFISTMPLKEYYTFDEFVEGPSNSYVFAAAKGVAKNPGAKALNPLFIHGGTGLGKTHIMQAIGNEIRRTYPNFAVCYLTAEALLNEYVNALTQGSLPSFRERYRKIDVLLIDDIQFIAKNMQNFQEEFFNTFNALTNADKQIVLTSDVAPKDIPGIEERLISRFEGGMLQEVESRNSQKEIRVDGSAGQGHNPEVHCLEHQEPCPCNGRRSQQGKHLCKPGSKDADDRSEPCHYSKGLHRKREDKKEDNDRRSQKLRVQEVRSLLNPDTFTRENAVHSHTKAACDVHLAKIHHKKPA